MIIHEFQKNTREKVRVELGYYNGNDVFAFRVYYLADADKDEWKPSPKGLTVRTVQIPELKKGIEAAYEAWKRGAYS